MKKLLLVLFFVTCLTNQAVADDKYNLLCPNGTHDALEKAGYVPEIDISCLNNASVRFSNPDADMMLVSYAIARSDLVDTKKVAVLFFDNDEISVLSPWFMNLNHLENYIRKKTLTPFIESRFSNLNIENFTGKKIIQQNGKYCVDYKFKFPFEGNVIQCPTKEAYTIAGEVGYVDDVFTWPKALELYLKAYRASRFKYDESGLLDISLNFWNGYTNKTLVSISDDGSPKVEYYLFKEEAQSIEKNVLAKVYPEGAVKILFLPRYGFSSGGDHLLKIQSCFETEKALRQCQKIANHLPFIEMELKNSTPMPKLPVLKRE